MTTSLIARSPEDVLALVPVVLGFEPAESLVLLTFGAAHPFHARVDLPRGPDAIAAVAEQLVAPARHHGARRVLLVAYSDDDAAADRVLRRVARCFRDAGLVVHDCLRTDGRRWHPVPRRPGVPDHGVPYDLRDHPFAAQAVYDGVVVRGSREEVAATLAEDGPATTRVITALAALGPSGPALLEARWARALVARHTEARTPCGDAEAARLLRAMLDLRVRDAAWSVLTRPAARAHVEFWTDVVRRSPGPLAAAPAALLGFAAWQAGEGALAWCAVDRAVEARPGYSLAGLVADALTRAVPPSVWEGLSWEEDDFFPAA